MVPINPTAVVGFLALFLLYQLAEANGQNLIHLPKKPYSIFALFLLVLLVAVPVGFALDGNGLSAFHMGLHPGWWQGYLAGLGLGIAAQILFETIGNRLGIRKFRPVRLDVRSLAVSFLWILVGNFPAAAAEDLLTRGFPYRFLHDAPMVVFLVISVGLYTTNHIIRLLTRPISNWYFLPFLGLTLAFVLAQTGTLWPVIGLHQSANVVGYCMNQTMQVENTSSLRGRMVFGVLSELMIFALVVLILH